MARLRLLIAYDGRPYAGWQSQPSGLTVQDTLEQAFPKILPDLPAPRLSASGRTDAGVHALGQVAHFDTPAGSTLPPEAWQRALNVHLPPTIRIMSCAVVPDTFHSRFDATGKTYRYRLWTGRVLPPLEAGLACHHQRHRVCRAGCLCQTSNCHPAGGAPRRDAWRTYVPRPKIPAAIKPINTDNTMARRVR